MDGNGARHLAARIRAGIALGARVELVRAEGDDPVEAGERGEVVAVTEAGLVVVEWDRGVRSEVEPDPDRLALVAS